METSQATLILEAISPLCIANFMRKQEGDNLYTEK